MPHDLEQAVVSHYTARDLVARIGSVLDRAQLEGRGLQVSDLAPVDEFHIGGRAATEYAVAKLSLDASHHVLDIGCGIGGAARYLASAVGCRVTGIDLTPDYIAAAQDLSSRTGLGSSTTFIAASALDMPFAAGAFDAAISFHVAMNIADRPALYREAARVLKPGAALCIYDVMRGPNDGLDFPLPWAAGPETSFLTSPAEMRDLLAEAGFEVAEEDDRTVAGIAFFRRRLAAPADDAPQLGLHLVIGDGRRKFENVLRGLENGAISPVVMVARRTG